MSEREKKGFSIEKFFKIREIKKLKHFIMGVKLLLLRYFVCVFRLNNPLLK